MSWDQRWGQRIDTGKPIPYRSYMFSPAWRARADERLQRARYRCLACGGQATQVHHLTYKRACYIPAREYDWDLMALCGWCHDLIGWWCVLLGGKPSAKRVLRPVSYAVVICRRLSTLVRRHPARVRVSHPFRSARVVRWLSLPMSFVMVFAVLWVIR